MTSEKQETVQNRTLRLYRALRYVLIITLVTGSLFIVLEGVCSLATFGYRFVTYQPLAERAYTEYDELLGWINKPEQDMPDMYGPGIGLRTNRQRFRNNQDVDQDVPEGKRRIICSGDSFTFGYGVSNEQAWCHLLVAERPNWESVNMAQGGYGIDQAYLWYKRDGAPLEHDVHIFAFITGDFDRAGTTDFIGYGKPKLTIADGELRTTNVPVPIGRAMTPFMNRLNHASEKLSCVRIGKRISGRLSGREQSELPDVEPSLREIAAGVFKDLASLNEQAGSTLVLVHLPVDTDYGPSDADLWRGFLQEQSRLNGCHYVDLVSEFRQLPTDQIQRLFIQEGEVDYVGAAGHYSAAGNEYVAKTLKQKLMSIPAVAQKLSD